MAGIKKLGMPVPAPAVKKTLGRPVPIPAPMPLKKNRMAGGAVRGKKLF